MNSIISKYSKWPVQAKASFWYTICNFLQKGISFIVVPIYVRLLTTAEYGEWAVFQSWRDILIIFASLNLYAGVYTKTLVDKDKDRDCYTSAMQGLGTVVSIGFLAIYFFSHEWCQRVIGLSMPYMLLLFAYFIVYPAFSFWCTRQRVEYKYKSMVAVTALISILTPCISIVLLCNTNLREKALILGYLVVQCAVGSVCYFFQFWKGKCFYHKEYWKYALHFNIPLIPHYLSLIVLNQSDRIMIKHYCGEGDTGIYSFAYQISSAINVLISAINGSRVPWTYEQLKAKTYTSLKRITNILVLLMAGISLIVCVVSPEIIWTLGTSDYQSSIYVIPVVTLGVYYTFVYDLYASIEFYYGATNYIMFASVTGALLNVLLNAIFIPLFGFIAAAYTTLFCYIVFMIMHFIFAKKVLREQCIECNVYDNGTIFGLSTIVSVLCLGCMLTFPYPIIRFLIVLLIVTISFFLRDKIKQLWYEIKI